MNTKILGLDFGGTKLAAGVFDANRELLLARRVCPTPSGGAPASMQAMLAMVQELLLDHPQVSMIGVSFGGPIDPDGRTVRLSMHIPGWEQFPLATQLEQILQLPTRLANDGDAAALAEQRLGAGRGMVTLLYVTASTGIGGGIVINGRIHRGERGWAGEVGHILLDPHGPACPCGRNGCLEALASGLSIARDMRIALANSPQPSILHAQPPDQISALHVAESAQAGDALAQQVWTNAMLWIGRGLASAANLLNPGRIVVGGGLTRAADMFFTPVCAEAARRAMDPELQIVPAAFGDDVGILGGVALWLN